MVIGTTEKSCKTDSNRIEYILGLLDLKENKDITLSVIGDNFLDFKNYEQASKICPHHSEFWFVNTKMLKDLENLKKQIEELKEAKKELEESKKELKEKLIKKDKLEEALKIIRENKNAIKKDVLKIL